MDSKAPTSSIVSSINYGGVCVISHPGVRVKPRWYDFPRRLGWRAPKSQQIVEDGQIINFGDRWFVSPRTFRQLKEAMELGQQNERDSKKAAGRAPQSYATDVGGRAARYRL